MQVCPPRVPREVAELLNPHARAWVKLHHVRAHAERAQLRPALGPAAVGRKAGVEMVRKVDRATTLEEHSRRLADVVPSKYFESVCILVITVHAAFTRHFTKDPHPDDGRYVAGREGAH